MKSREVDSIIPTIPPSLHNSFSTSVGCSRCLASLIERLVCQVQALYHWLHLITLNMGVATRESLKNTISIPPSLCVSHSF